MLSLVFLNISHETKRYQKQESVQRATWCQPNGNIVFKWVYGNSRILYEDAFDKIYVPVGDTFDNIFLKTLYSIEFVSKKYDPDFIVRGNTNTYVDTKFLLEEIAKIEDRDYLYGYKSNHYEAGTNETIEFISGGMMVMPRYTYKKIKTDSVTRGFGPDDVALSFFLANSGTELIASSRGDISHGANFSPSSHYRIKHSTVSSFTNSRMKAIHKLYLKEKDISKISTRSFISFQIFEFIYILFEKKSDVQKEIILLIILKRILNRCITSLSYFNTRF